MKRISEFEFYSELANQVGVLLLVFTAPGCRTCRVMKGLLREYELIQEGLQVWEVDAVENGSLVREYEVFHLPAIFLFRGGQFWRPIHSEMRMPDLRSAVDQALNLPPLEPP